MAFAVDRDLLVYEPGVFSEAAWTAQRLVSVTDAAVVGSTLTTNKADFDASGIGAGHVVVVEGVTMEVVARLSATSLAVSALRADASGAALPVPGPLTGRATIHTLAPQIELAHREALRRAGIAPAGEEGDVAASAIVNGDALRDVEALGALRLVYAAASLRADSPSGMKAAMHAERFERALRRARFELDLDGDGEVDETRRVGVGTLERA